VQKRLTSLFAGSYGDYAGEKFIENLRCRDYFSIFSALEISSEYRARSRISRKAGGNRGRSHPHLCLCYHRCRQAHCELLIDEI